MKNSLFIGVLLGSIAPLIAIILQHYTRLSFSFFPEKPMAIYVVAATINVILMRILFKKQQDETAKGIILITFIAAIVYIFTGRLLSL